MADKNKQSLPQTGPAADDPQSAKRPTAQGEELRKASQPSNQERREAGDDGEPKFFDTTITKLVKREVEDEKGNVTEEWVEVMMWLAMSATVKRRKVNGMHRLITVSGILLRSVVIRMTTVLGGGSSMVLSKASKPLSLIDWASSQMTTR